MVPLIFLGVAAFLLNVVLTRDRLAVQREQIAALKALGYGNGEIGLPLRRNWSLAISLAGAAIGIAGGAWLGSAMTGLYNDFFRFPVLTYRLVPEVVLGAVGDQRLRRAPRRRRRGAAGGAPAAGRGDAPRAAGAPIGVSWLERAGLRRLLSQSGRMVLRNLERQPLRTALSVVGIGFAATMMVLGTFFVDSIDELMRIQFEVAQRQDVMVSFVLPRGAAAFYEVRRLPGVLDAEPVRAVPVRLSAGHRSRQLAITGLPAEQRLLRVIDDGAEPVTLPAGGLALSESLAEILGAGVGDRGDGRGARGGAAGAPGAGGGGGRGVHGHHGLHGGRRAPPADARGGRRLGRHPARRPGGGRHALPAPEGAAGGGGGQRQGGGDRELPRDPGREHVRDASSSTSSSPGSSPSAWSTTPPGSRSRSARASWRACASSASPAPRSRSILLGELAALTLTALPVGLALGYAGARMLVRAFETELYRFPLIIAPRTYAWAAVLVVVAAVVSGLAVRRKLDRLDLVAVLKTRE